MVDRVLRRVSETVRVIGFQPEGLAQHSPGQRPGEGHQRLSTLKGSDKATQAAETAAIQRSARHRVNAETLRQLVREAFPAVPPGSHPIVVHECPECAEIDASFRDQQWDRIRPEIIDKHWDSLPFLSREAFEYLLPAYILHAIDHLESNVPEFLMYSLDKPRWPRETWTLTPQQLAVVGATAEWLHGELG